MNVTDVTPGVVLTTEAGHWMVREVEIKADKVRLLLSAGRTDSGAWYEFEPYEEFDVYTPQ